jgi:hypothetical protein
LKVRLIAENRSRLPVERECRLAELKRSSFYTSCSQLESRREQRNRYLVDAEQGERHSLPHVSEGHRHPLLRPVADCLGFGPATVAVGHSQRLGVLAPGQPAIMRCQVDLDEARPVGRSFGMGLNRCPEQQR